MVSELTEFGGFCHIPSRKIQRAKWTLRRISSTIGDGQDISSFGEYIDHGVEDGFDLDYNEVRMVLGSILRNVHNSRRL